MQGSCFICNDLKVEHFTSKLESQPLKDHLERIASLSHARKGCHFVLV